MENTPPEVALRYIIQWGKRDRRKPRRECDKCGRVVAHFQSGKPYNHKCEDK